MPQQHRGALVKRRPRQALARPEVVRELAENPRIPLRRAADHDGVAARRRADGIEVVIGAHVTVGDDGHAHGLLDAADDVPVRLAAVELLARAAVHGDGVDARGLGAPCELDDVYVLLVPAHAHLDGHGHLHRAADGREDALRLFRLAHERGALAVLDDLRRGAAHVEIEDVGRAERLDVACRLGRHLRRIRKDLHRERPLAGLRGEHRERALIPEMDALARYHLRVAERAAHLVRDDAVGRIRDARHRREENGRLEAERADADAPYIAHACGFLSRCFSSLRS